MAIELKISEIQIPQGLLPRIITGTIEEKVNEYAEMIENGVEFDPIKVWKRPDGTYWLIDGAHRIEAYKRAGYETIRAEFVHCRDELDFRIKAIEANLKHGIPLLAEEKKLLAYTLHKAGADKQTIIKLFGISERTYYRWIDVKEEKIQLIEKARELREQGESFSQIANKLGITKRTVLNWAKKSGENFDMMAKISPPSQLEPEEEVPYYMKPEVFKNVEKERLEYILKEYESGKISFEEYVKLRRPAGEELIGVHDEYWKNYALPEGFKTEDELFAYAENLPEVKEEKEEEKPKKKRGPYFVASRFQLTPKEVLEEYRIGIAGLAYECMLYFGKEVAIKVLETVLEELENEWVSPKFKPRSPLPPEDVEEVLGQKIDWDLARATVEYIEDEYGISYRTYVVHKGKF